MQNLCSAHSLAHSLASSAAHNIVATRKDLGDRCRWYLLSSTRAPHTHCGSPVAHPLPKTHPVPLTLRVVSRIAGRFLPTHTLSGPQDRGTTGPRDYETARLLEGARLTGSAWERLRMTENA